jgi:hypothetical protein
LVEGATILLAFEGTDSSRNSTRAVLEASTLINLGSRVFPYMQSVYKRTYIKSPVELCGSIILKPSNQMSKVKLLNRSVSCDFEVLVVLLGFFQFFYILITFHLTTVLKTCH